MSLFRRSNGKGVLDHQHRWFATGTTKFAQATTVMYFCPDCRGNKTTMLDGRWTLREIAGYDKFDPDSVDPPVTPDMVEQAKQDIASWVEEPSNDQ